MDRKINSVAHNRKDDNNIRIGYDRINRSDHISYFTSHYLWRYTAEPGDHAQNKENNQWGF